MRSESPKPEEITVPVGAVMERRTREIRIGWKAVAVSAALGWLKKLAKETREMVG